MVATDYFIFILKGLIRRKLRSWLTVIGIFIGIAAVVSLIGLGEGLRESINAQFGFVGADVMVVTASGGLGPPGTGVVDPLTEKEIKAIKTIPGVEGVTGRIIESGKIVYNNKAGFGFAASMPSGEGRELVQDVLNMKAIKGRFLKDGDSGVVFLGYAFYEDDEAFGKIIDVSSKIKILDLILCYQRDII